LKKEKRETMLKMGLITVMVFAATILGASREGVSMVQLGATRNEEVESARVSEQGDEVREEFHQTYPLSPNGRVYGSRSGIEVRSR
jgi:hypothetical protein